MASTNRLRLDFSLETNEERVAFLDKYLQQPEFIKRPPTDDELETMGNYLLWGKNPETGLNAKQEKICDIETKHKTWDSNAVESLEGLMEQPTFNEATLQPLAAGPPLKATREVFSRKEALAKCPDYLVPTLTNLFRQIDELDLAINYYDLAHGKRKNPPRDTLLIKFTDEQKEALRQSAEQWNQYTYLRQRHNLVEMRREQYTLRDSFAPIIATGGNRVITEPIAPPTVNAEIEVLPLGTKGNKDISRLLFQPWEDIHPWAYTEEELQQISNYLWKKENYQPTGTQMYVDFRELEHVYQLFQLFFELEDAAEAEELEHGLTSLLETLRFYTEQAELNEVQKEILDMKLHKEKNVDIADKINKKWGKSYTANYISTIFRQRIIPKINDAAAYHIKLVSNVFFEEEFKTCSGCKKIMLRDENNFTHKARSKDGFTTRCKKCEKASRAKSKEVITNDKQG